MSKSRRVALARPASPDRRAVRASASAATVLGATALGATALVLGAGIGTASAATAPVINQIAGSGSNRQFTGPASGVVLDQIQGLATDPAGDLYVDNTEDDQVGEIGPAVPPAPNNVFTTDTAHLAWSNPVGGSVTGNSETATTVGGVPAWNWTASSVAGNTWIFVPETLQNHTTYTGNITVEGSGQIYLDFFNGAQDFESPTITLSNTSQTLSLTVTTNLGTPEFQLRTPTTEALDVTATDAEIVNDTPTRTAQPIADTDELATLDDVNGNPTNLGDGGPATSATLNQPSAVATDGHGDVYIADTENNLVREVTPDGTIRTVAGTGQPGDTGDGGPATDAELNNPSGVAVNAAGDLFIADSQNNVIREVTPTGTISTVAGHPTSGPLAGEGGPFNATTGLGGGGFGGDGGPATDSLLESPEGLAVDSAGDLFIADTGNSAIREIDTSGTITTVAGQGDDFADTGDGGPATQAALDAPYDVAVDAAGDLYIADTLNNAVREVTSTGTITTLAGGNGQGNNGLGGTASQAQLDTPESVAVDSTTGDVYVSSLAGIVDDISGLPATATGPTPALGETPLTVVLPLAGVAAVAPIVVRRRRRLIGRTA